MDHSVPIPKKRPQQILRPAPREPLTAPRPAKASIKSLLKHQAKAQHRTLRQAKPALLLFTPIVVGVGEVIFAA